jgi:hypothetical protein
MTKIQKTLDFTCQECFSAYQLLEIHQQELKPCAKNCLASWKNLLHQHFQDQVILYLAQKEKENDPDNHD